VNYFNSEAAFYTQRKLLWLKLGLWMSSTRLFDNLLLAKHPELKVNVVNTEVSGKTVIDLKSRWEERVFRPHNMTMSFWP
jgi:hypothetical protein